MSCLPTRVFWFCFSTDLLQFSFSCFHFESSLLRFVLFCFALFCLNEIITIITYQNPVPYFGTWSKIYSFFLCPFLYLSLFSKSIFILFFGLSIFFLSLSLSTWTTKLLIKSYKKFKSTIKFVFFYYFFCVKSLKWHMCCLKVQTKFWNIKII